MATMQNCIVTLTVHRSIAFRVALGIATILARFGKKRFAFSIANWGIQWGLFYKIGKGRWHRLRISGKLVYNA